MGEGGEGRRWREEGGRRRDKVEGRGRGRMGE